jgi:phage-related protein
MSVLGSVISVGILPITLIVAAIVGFVAAIVAMYRESEIFRKAIKDLIDGVLNKVATIFDKLKKKFDDAIKPLSGLTEAFGKVGEAVGVLGGVVDALKTAFKFLGDIIGTYGIPFLLLALKNALDVVGAVFGTIIDTIGNVIAAFAKIWEGISTGNITMVFEGIVDAILAPFKALGSNLIDLFISIWNNIVEAVKKVLGIASPSQVFTDIATAIFDALKNTLGGIVGFFTEIFTNAWNAVFDYFTQTVIPFVSSIPSKILDLLSTMWDIYIDALTTVWGLVTSWFTNTAVPWITGLPERIRLLLSKMWDIYINAIKIVWGLVTSWFTATAVPWITGLPGRITNLLKNMWSIFSTGLTTAWGLVKDTWGNVTTTVSGWVSSLSGKIKTIWNGFFDGLKEAWLSIKNYWNNLPIVTAGLKVDVPDWITSTTGMKDFNLRFPPLGLAEGGIISAKSGGTLALIGEGGRSERVEPLDSNGLSKRDIAMINLLSGGGGGLTVNVYPSPGMDETEIASIVSREISFQMRRGSV